MHGEIIAPVIGAVGAGRTVLKNWTNEAPFFLFFHRPPQKIKISISGTFWGLPGCHLCDAVIPQVLPGGNALTVENAWVLEERQCKNAKGEGGMGERSHFCAFISPTALKETQDHFPLSVQGLALPLASVQPVPSKGCSTHPHPRNRASQSLLQLNLVSGTNERLY